MAHSVSLRAIGQSLEIAKVAAFDLERDGSDYILRSDSLTKTGEWILRNTLSTNDFVAGSARQTARNRVLRFSPHDIVRIDAEGRKRRRNPAPPDTQKPTGLSQLLRTLGDHLDRTEANEFYISWKPDAVFVDYQPAGGQADRRTFTPEKLQQLGSHSRFRRSHRDAR